MRSELTEFAARYDVLHPGDTVLCAVSGGIDSVSLLHALLHAGMGLHVICAHYNHLLRGEESDRDESFVCGLCDMWGVPFVSGQGDVQAFAREEGCGIEEAARDMRYAFLERTAKEYKAQWIAVAHTADDNAETMLLNLTRGAGPRGLRGIPPVRGRIVRPFLSVTREQLENYMDENDLPHIEDSSNQEDEYTRNRLRHFVMPILRDINPGFVLAAARTSALLQADDAYLESLAESFLQNTCKSNGGSVIRLPITELLELPRPLSSRVLRRAAGVTLSFMHTEALYALCRNDNPSASLSLPGMIVRREYDQLVFGRPSTELLPERPIKPGESFPLPEAGLILCSDIVENCPVFHRAFNTFYFSYDKICGKLIVKSRAEGERIRLLGRSGTRSLKKMMIDAGIPRTRRGLIPVLADDEGPLAVYGFGQAERCAAMPGEKALLVEIIPENKEMEL